MTTICALTVPSIVRPATAKRDVSARAFGGKKGGVAAAVPRAGQTYANIGAAVDAGLLQGSAPFEDGIDLFGFFNNIDQAEAQRYADVEITHGRLAMLASVGFIVGEQVEGSSFLFDAQVTGPAINHFQQVPLSFWIRLGALIFFVETTRVQIAWQDPFNASRLFLMKDDHTPGDYGGFDPRVEQGQRRGVAGHPPPPRAEQRPPGDGRHHRHGRAGAQHRAEPDPVR